MIPIIYGAHRGSKDKTYLGLRMCESCHCLTEQFATYTYTRPHIYYIPIMNIHTGHFVRCDACGSVEKYERSEWRKIRDDAKGMPKRKVYSAAYAKLKEIAETCDTSELNAESLYTKLMSALGAEDKNGHYRNMVELFTHYSATVANRLAPAAVSAAPAAPAAVSYLPVPAPAAAAVPVAAAALATETAAPATETASPAAEVAAPSAETAAPATVAAPTAPAAVATAAPTADATPAAPAVRYIPVAETTPVVNAAAPVFIAPPVAAAANTKKNKLRKLWLIPAILLVPIALILLIATISIVSDMVGTDAFDLAETIILLIFFLIPAGLSGLFFHLACRKD